MRNIILGLALASAAAFAALPAAASDASDIMAIVKTYNDAFNKGDVKTAVALCMPQTFIIDDFAPHLWQGANTCQGWVDALAAFEKKEGIADDLVTLGKPWHVSATGDRGYAVYPTHYSYKLKGKPVLEAGVWTFALEKTSAGWRIAGWAWAQH